jgi:hypothetical protein
MKDLLLTLQKLNTHVHMHTKIISMSSYMAKIDNLHKVDKHLKNNFQDFF